MAFVLAILAALGTAHGLVTFDHTQSTHGVSIGTDTTYCSAEDTHARLSLSCQSSN